MGTTFAFIGYRAYSIFDHESDRPVGRSPDSPLQDFKAPRMDPEGRGEAEEEN